MNGYYRGLRGENENILLAGTGVINQQIYKNKT